MQYSCILLTYLTLRLSGTARWKDFILTYSVGLSKLYRIVLESWESVQAKRFVPLFSRGTIFTHVWIACRHRGAQGRLRVIKFERIVSRRVVLPVGLCLVT